MNENLIKAIADSVGETLLSERDRTSAGLALLADQVKSVETAFSSRNAELAAALEAATASLKTDLRNVATGAAHAVTESDSIKSALADLQARLTDLASGSDLSSHIAVFETTRTELLGWIEDLKSASEAADKQLDARIASEVDTIKSETVKALSALAGLIEGYDKSASETAAEAEKRFGEQLKALDARFESSLSVIEAEHKTAYESAVARLAAFSDEVSKLMDAVSKQDITALESGAALTALEEQHAALAPQVASAFEAIEDAKKAITVQTGNIKSEIQAIRSELESGAASFAELAARYPEKGDKGADGEAGAGIIVAHWEPGIYREGAIVQYDLGRYAKALRDTADAPGSADWARLGTSGFAWKGVKRDDEEYEDGDFFIDDGTAFLFVAGKPRMFAKRGEKGIKGDKGDKGEKGTPAPAVIDVAIADNKLTFVRDDGEVFSAPLDALAPFIKAQAELAVVAVLKTMGLVR